MRRKPAFPPRRPCRSQSQGNPRRFPKGKRRSSPARTAGSPTSSRVRSAAHRPSARSRTPAPPRPRRSSCSTSSRASRSCRGRSSTARRPWRRSTRWWTNCGRDRLSVSDRNPPGTRVALSPSAAPDPVWGRPTSPRSRIFFSTGTGRGLSAACPAVSPHAGGRHARSAAGGLDQGRPCSSARRREPPRRAAVRLTFRRDRTRRRSSLTDQNRHPAGHVLDPAGHVLPRRSQAPLIPAPRGSPRRPCTGTGTASER